MPSHRHPSTSQASRRRVGALVTLIFVTASGCGADGAGTGQSTDGEPVVALVDAETLGAELTAELERSGLESVASAIAEIDLSTLVDDREFTLLAPTDDAFVVASADELADLLADPDALLGLLRNHVIPSTLRAGELADISTVRTGAGHELDVTALDDGTLVIGGATVVSADAAVGDGVVHTIDRLLIPEDDG